MIAVGDKVKYSDFYLSNYCGLDPFRGKIATVKKLTEREVPAINLQEDKQLFRMYVEKFGNFNSYGIIGLYIQFPDDVALYLVSPFGVDKVS